MIGKYYMSIFVPFIISFIGVIADYITTSIGLGLGFYETHLQYNPVIALMIFWGALSVLSLTLPNKKAWTTCKNIIALTSFLGSANNTLVILGIFTGIII